MFNHLNASINYEVLKKGGKVMNKCGKEWCEEALELDCDLCERKKDNNPHQLLLFPVPRPKRREIAQLNYCMINKYMHLELSLDVDVDYGEGEIEKEWIHEKVNPWELSVVFSTENEFSPLYHLEKRQIIVNNITHLIAFQDY
jgi:hypothetical protein